MKYIIEDDQHDPDLVEWEPEEVPDLIYFPPKKCESCIYWIDGAGCLLGDCNYKRGKAQGFRA